MQPADVDDLCKVLEAEGRHYALIAAETLIKAMEGGNENDAGDMTRAFAQYRRVLAHGDGLLMGAHTGWSEADRPRGSSAGGGDLETLLRVTREEGSQEATVLVRKQKNGRDGQSFTLAIEQV